MTYRDGECVVVTLRPNLELKYSLKSIAMEGTLLAADAEMTRLGVYFQISDAQASGPNAEVRQVQHEAGVNK